MQPIHYTRLVFFVGRQTGARVVLLVLIDPAEDYSTVDEMV